ncbi:hypothetical protein [Actinomadura chokoriensis]|uniref:Uncharacterized protein n=1 Tax=Actinomadura chokoriensis TaxID=454156 RepID=A0ABV4R336_9ACTN
MEDTEDPCMSAPGKEDTVPGTRHHTHVEADEVSRSDGASMLHKAARRRLNISGEEFLSRWDHGYYDDTDDPAVADVAMLIPFAR